MQYNVVFFFQVRQGASRRATLLKQTCIDPCVHRIVYQVPQVIMYPEIYQWTILLQVCIGPLNPLPDMPILGFSISAVNKHMMPKYGQMGIQLSVRVENIVGKGEIAPYEQFLLFPQCFQKLSG